MSLIVTLIGLWFAVYPVIDKLFSGDILEWHVYDLQMFAFCATFLILAGLLWFMEPRLSRLLVPIPKNRCPQCNYRLEQLTRPQCPECGLPLPPQLIQTQDSSEK